LHTEAGSIISVGEVPIIIKAGFEGVERTSSLTSLISSWGLYCEYIKVDIEREMISRQQYFM
jgi:hypothetical protein